MEWIPRTLTPEQKQERRLYAGRLLQQGELSQAEIARQVGVSSAAVCKWAARLTTDPSTLSALENRSPKGREPRLTAAQWDRLLKILASGALARGYDTDRWTLRRVADVIREQFGASYHHRSLGRCLRARGWSPQLPAPRSSSREDEVVAAWLARDWPRIKKTLAGAGQRSSSSTRRASGSTSGPDARGRRRARRRS